MSGCSAPAAVVSSGPVGGNPLPAGTQPTVAGSAVTGGTPAPSAAPSAASAVAAALTSLVAATPQPSRDQIRASLTAAGFAPAALEVSASRTPTGLAADAVEVGVLTGHACVMAQIRSGTVQSSVLPALADGRCFVGSVPRSTAE
ncbi:DUF6993 domain-containing protein [Pseudarthrobacter sp. So.54]